MIISVRQTAEKLGVNYRTVLRNIASGKIPARRLGKDYLIDDSKLDKGADIRPLEIAVAVVVRGGKVLIVRRCVKEGRLEWQFPAGTLKYRENTKIRAEIECLEETGIHCRAVKKLGKRIHPDTRVVTTYCLCEYLSGEPYAYDSHENTQAEWVDKKEALRRFTSDVYKPIKILLGGV